MKPSTLNTAVGVLCAVAGIVPGATAAGINRNRVVRRAHGNHHHNGSAPHANHSTIATESVITMTSTTRSGCALKVVTLTTTTDMTITVTPGQSTESTSSLVVTPFLTLSTTGASSPSAQTTAVTIDTSLAPITTGPAPTTTKSVTDTVVPTTTISGDSGPTGTPAAGAVHCGVHGLPVGDFFLGEYVENSADVPVTLEGCYEFCSTAWGATNGCESYDFYHNSLGAPRCDLYSAPVAYALDTVDNNEPNLWFDLACGDPTSARWANTYNHTAVARSLRGGSRRV